MTEISLSGRPINLNSLDSTPSSSRQQQHLSKAAPSQLRSANQNDSHSPPPSQASAPALLLQLLLMLSLIYLAVLYRANLTWALSVACTVACALIAWQWPSKKTGEERPHPPNQQRQQPQSAMLQKSQYPTTHDLSGIWIKDKGASDSMDETLHVMQVNKIIRGAIRLVRGTELKQTKDSFQIAVLSGILWFKIVEEYPFSGEMRQFKRRDLRKGMHRGTVQKLDDGAVCVTLEWDPPLGGLGTDVFYTVREGLLYADSTILIDGRLIKYRTVYNRLKR